jgi:hypothetical protein
MRARRASGSREEGLVKKAKTLRQSVDLLLPKRTRACPPEAFDRLREQLEGVRELKDDEKRLERSARRGEPMARAYAGLLRFSLNPELSGVVVARFPGGEVSFAPLARAPKEIQVAVQNFDDPERLLLGYLRWARKKGFHFWATSETLLCTGRDPTPPPEFVQSKLRALPYRVQPKPERHTVDCAHLAAGEFVPYLSVGWPATVGPVRVCRRCARADRQLLASLSEGTAVPRPETLFPVETSLNVDCHGGDECVHQGLPALPRGLRRRYQLGRLADAELLDAYRQVVTPLLERTRRPTWVAAGVCYGSDMDAFVRALRPTSEEERALRSVLPKVDTLFEVDEASASRALEKLWREHAETIVAAIVPDRAEAKRLTDEARANPGRVSDLLHRAAQRTQERALLSSLPQYRTLSPEAGFVDGIARSYRLHGTPGAERRLEQSLPREGKERGLAWGLLEALGRESPHLWQFTETEREFGHSLVPRARELLDAPPEGYDRALGALLGAAGVTEWGERADAGAAEGRAPK